MTTRRISYRIASMRDTIDRKYDTTVSTTTYIGLEIEELVILSCAVEVRLATVGDVGETLLDGHDVATHLLHAVLVNSLEELRAVDQNRRRQVTQTLEDVPNTKT